MRAVFLLLVMGAFSSCQSSPQGVSPDFFDPDEGPFRIYMSSNGWHSEIIVATADLPLGAIPEREDFADAAFLALGWGDAAYYPEPEPGFLLTLEAAMTPTPAVVHLAGFSGLPPQVFPENEVLELSLGREAFGALIAYLHNSFERSGARRADPGAPGLYSSSRFYPATGTFHLFNNCNNWSARALETAGLNVRAAGTLSAEDLMVQVRPLQEP